MYVTTPTMKFFYETDDNGKLIYSNRIGDSDTYPNDNGDTVKDFAEACMQCARDNHIPTIDIHNNVGVNKYNRDTFYEDDSHFNEVGCERVGRFIASSIKGMQ